MLGGGDFTDLKIGLAFEEGEVSVMGWIEAQVVSRGGAPKRITTFVQQPFERISITLPFFVQLCVDMNF